MTNDNINTVVFYEGWKCEKETQLPPFYYGTSEDISRTEAVTALSRKGKT